MVGEALAILTALMWAASTVLSAEALKKVDPIRSNMMRTFFAALLMLPIAFWAGEMRNLSGVSLQGLSLVTAAAIIGFGIGDTLLLRSFSFVGVSAAYTFAYTYPLFTMAVAVVLLGEPFRLAHLAGTILIMFGIVLIAARNNGSHSKSSRKGLLTALGTSLTWATGTILVALGVREISVLLANTLRYAALFFFLFAISHPGKKWNLDKKSLAILSASGALGMVFGGITFLESLNLLGASRATSLSASSPVWASLMSSFFLKEKVTPSLFLASVVVVVGTYFLTI